MAKAAAGEVIVLNFNDEFRIERLPFRGSFSGPAARAGSIAGEAWWFDQFLKLLRQRRLLVRFEARRETHVMQ